MFTGKVTASAIGRYNPGFACGTVIFIAAGTAIYEALAAKTANINLFVTSVVTNELNNANKHPFINGTITANTTGNNPNEKNAFSFLPLVMPMSKRKMARNPLNKSLVNGLIPSACFAFAIKPITKLPKINNTLPFVKECFITDGILILVEDFSLLNKEINTNPTIIAGDSISAIMATMCP